MKRMATELTRVAKTRQTTAGAPVTDDAPSSPDKVVSAIYSGILSGRIVPGQKLIEADLAQDLGVSRGPIREAFKRLHAEGVIESTRHRGVYVRSLSRKEAFDFLEILEILTSFIAGKAAEAIEGADSAFTTKHAISIAALKRYIDAVDNDIQLDGSGRFYDALIAIGGNSQIASIMPVMRIQLFRMQGHFHLNGETRRQRISEYADVAKLVLAGDSAGSRRAMKAHMRATGKRLAALPDNAYAR